MQRNGAPLVAQSWGACRPVTPPPDGEELTGPVLVGALPNHKEGVQDGNEAIFVDGDYCELVKAFRVPLDEIFQGFEYREARVANSSRR